MRISYHIFNSLNSENLLTVIMPFEYKKAVKGFYSNLWKDLKTSCANSYHLDKRFVRLKILKDQHSWRVPKRMVLIFPSGMKFDSPFELNETDFKIIDLHMEAINLSLSK